MVVDTRPKFMQTQTGVPRRLVRTQKRTMKYPISTAKLHRSFCPAFLEKRARSYSEVFAELSSESGGAVRTIFAKSIDKSQSG